MLPISAVPLIPIISNSYGIFAAFIVTLAGWFLGAFISFWLAKTFGKPLIKKLISLDKLEQFEKLFPEKHKFFGLVLVRILVPLDALNYFLGIFTKVKVSTFTITTLIGLLPITLFLVYVGNLPAAYQSIGFVAGILFIIGIWIIIKIFGFNKLKNIVECYGLVCER